MVKVNDVAPAFSLPSTSGKTLSLGDLRGRKVILYFYPKDDTPGCTIEACDFRDNIARLGSAKAVVLGVSKDTLASHNKFRAKYSLPFELLVDADNALAKAYGAYGQKMMYGKPVVGTIRSTFVIDEKGKIAAMWSPVKVDGHVDAVLAAVKGGGAPAKTSAPKKKAVAKRAPVVKSAKPSTAKKKSVATKTAPRKAARPVAKK